MVHTAIIIASDKSCFRENGELIPKGFVEVKGIPIVVWSVETLISCGFDRIIIGTGNHEDYYEELIKEYPGVVCCHNLRYAETGSLYTLWNCRELIGNEDFLLMASDLIYEPKAIVALLESSYECAMLTTSVRKPQDSCYVEEDKRHRFIKWSKSYHDLNACSEYVGINKVSNKFFKAICRNFERDISSNERSSYESFFEMVSSKACPIYVLSLKDLEWYKVDDEANLKFAEQNIQIKHKRHTYHTSVNNMRKSPYVCYRNERYLQHTETINKEDARYLLNTLRDVFCRNGIEFMLAYGTLLGAIREHDFIGHDADMDTMIWSQDMQKGLDMEDELKRYDITLDCYVLPWIFTYRYKNVTCDIDVIWDAPMPIGKRYCYIQSQHVPRAFFERTETIEFQGERHAIPANPEELLVYHYGRNWRIPSNKHARLESKLFVGEYIRRFVVRRIRFIKKRCSSKN